MKKRIIASLMTAVLTASMLAGCGGGAKESDSGAAGDNDSEEPYEATLLYIVANDAATGIDAVEEAFNALTMEELNIKVDLLPMSISTYNQQLQLLLSGGEKLDLFPLNANRASSFIDSGYLVDLNDYLDQAPETVEMLGMDDIMCCSMNDFIWGFPIMAERAHPTGFIMREDILKEVGYKIEDIQSFDDLTEVYAKVHEAHPEMTVLGGNYTSTLPWLNNSVDPLGDRFGVLDNYGESTEVVNYYETEEFKTCVEQMHEWYEAGYVSKDLATCTENNISLMRAGNMFSFSNNVKPDTEQETENSTGMDVAVWQYNDDFLSTWGTSTFGFCVASNSENPAKAVELYNFIANSREANDLLNWGVEGADWIEAEDGSATFPEGVTLENVAYHQGYGWCMPNQQVAHVWNGTDPDVFDAYTEVTENAKRSPVYGFAFDSREVANEIAALTAVQEEFVYTISSGSVDPEAEISRFNEALYEAGLQDVMDEKQKQIDAWLEAHK